MQLGKRSKPKGEGTPVVTLPCAAAAGLTQLTTLWKSSKRNVNSVWVFMAVSMPWRKKAMPLLLLQRNILVLLQLSAVSLLRTSLNGKIKKGSEYPKFSSIQVPTIEKGGKKDAIKEERGDLTSHLLAHKKLLSGEALKATMTQGLRSLLLRCLIASLPLPYRIRNHLANLPLHYQIRNYLASLLQRLKEMILMRRGMKRRPRRRR
eukprot:scaffold4457_cov142-Skeletonema_marinoi.AAC.5